MAETQALGMYADCKRVFDAVLEHRGLSLCFYEDGDPAKTSPSKAINFRRRCYAYRVLLHKRQVKAKGVDIADTLTPYDTIRMKILKEKPGWLFIELAEVPAQVLDPQGNPVTFATPTDEEMLEAMQDTIDEPEPQPTSTGLGLATTAKKPVDDLEAAAMEAARMILGPKS